MVPVPKGRLVWSASAAYRRVTLWSFLALCAAIGLWRHDLAGGEPAVVAPDNSLDTPAASTTQEPLSQYMGRTIAPTMDASHAAWLTRATRQQEEDCRCMLQNLGVCAGMTVCDMGCGNGFYTLQLAKLVGREGRVLAVDIQQEMLRLLQARAAEDSLTNIELILGTPIDPKLPRAAIDLILCVDVYHEFTDPEAMLVAMRRSLRVNGQIVLVEFRAEDPAVPIKPEHKMSKAQVNKELTHNGFRLVREFDVLPWQHMMFFGCEPLP